jgi:hypothetical protein
MSLAGTPTQILDCRSCKARIFFAFHEAALGRAKLAGRAAAKSPIEAAPHPEGDLLIVRWAGAQPVVRKIDPDRLAKHAGEPRYRPHLAYCPQREQWTSGTRPGQRRRRSRQGGAR